MIRGNVTCARWWGILPPISLTKCVSVLNKALREILEMPKTKYPWEAMKARIRETMRSKRGVHAWI